MAQDRLALQSHVDQSGLSKLERGTNRGFGPLPLGRIAAVLGLTFDQLVESTDYVIAPRKSRTSLK
jgi:transcriptional regulator with XRE-family HTH domain